MKSATNMCFTPCKAAAVAYPYLLIQRHVLAISQITKQERVNAKLHM